MQLLSGLSSIVKPPWLLIHYSSFLLVLSLSTYCCNVNMQLTCTGFSLFVNYEQGRNVFPHLSCGGEVVGGVWFVLFMCYLFMKKCLFCFNKDILKEKHRMMEFHVIGLAADFMHCQNSTFCD